MTWSPLACGIISGKYGNGVPESSRASLKVFSLTSRKASGDGREGRKKTEQDSSEAACASWLRQSAALASVLRQAPLSHQETSAPGRSSQSGIHNVNTENSPPLGNGGKCPVPWLVL